MKISILRSLSTGILLLLTTCVYATPSADLSKLLNSVNSIQADFIQTTYDNHHKAVQRSFGKMALKRPGKFRWDVKKPIPQLIVANGLMLWIYDKDLDQVTIRAMHKATGEAPALLLSHSDASLDKEFTITEVQKNQPNWHWYELVPKLADNMFASVQMGFKANQINEMHLQDNLGHMTVIQFNNIQTNTPLPAALFTFKPPANVDIIDETKAKR